MKFQNTVEDLIVWIEFRSFKLIKYKIFGGIIN